MSRNLCRIDCQFCEGPVLLTEVPRSIREEDAGRYFGEYRGLTVANAACRYCGGRYLAWVANDPAGREKPRNGTHFDLSFRSTFNDEPGPDDRPSGGVVSSVWVESHPPHDHVSVWNNGALAGKLIVREGEGIAIALRLAPWLFEEEDA